jgi:LacI family transcriptional regulator, galactose operon repressor
MTLTAPPASDDSATAPTLPRAVTLRDVARAAGMSASTASRALNSTGYVSADARARLLAAAARLGYVANASARTLKQRTSRTIGVVVSAIGNPFYADLAAGIEETLRAAEYQMVLISDNSDSAQEIDGARTFLAMRAAGVIMTPVGSDAAALLMRHGIAVVELDRQLAKVPCDAVVIDNHRGARAATAHLLELGHRRVGLLAAKTNWTSDAGRLQGYRAAHRAAGVPIEPRLVTRIAPEAPDTVERVERLLDERPTAIFAANNVLTEQVWRAIRRRGARLPRDVSLVGFDDVPWMEMVEPGITTVGQPTVELGRRAARLLLLRADDSERPPTVVCLQPSLVLRGSTSPPG